jgi:multidrug efflux pump subunit AcrA (membrane-fusion protein)
MDPAKDPRILPDMGVKVSFLESSRKAGDKEKKAPAVALVPQKAVRQENGSSYVFVVKGDVLERRAVKIGETRGSDIEILGGIAPDVRVVVGGPEPLRDGQSVQIQK